MRRMWVRAVPALVGVLLFVLAAGSGLARADGQPSVCGIGGDPAACGAPAGAPWYFEYYAGMNYTGALDNCGAAGMAPFLAPGPWYAGPGAAAADVVKAYGGTVSSIEYTDFYRHPDGTPYNSYSIYLTGSSCLDSLLHITDPTQPAIAAAVTYGGTAPYGQVCSDDTYVPSGQGCGTGCPPDYCTPADWDAHTVPGTLVTGLEPLNVIISAKSTVPIDQILHGLNGWWEVPTGTKWPACLSPETADVTGQGAVVQDRSWRFGDCVSGNALSVFGGENHARLWHQPIPGSAAGAWFVTASFERLCLVSGRPWHCIVAGGYDRGARWFVAEINSSAKRNKWQVTYRQDQRTGGADPGAGTGLGGVAYAGTVYVVTVTA